MSSECQFWISNNAGQDKLRIPVLPEQITVTHDSQNESVMVAGLGEVTIIQDPSAKTFEWSCWFPAKKHQGCIDNPLAPQAYVDKIEEWIASKKPVKFSITGTKVNLFCSIESWNYYEKGGDPGTFYYTIKLKEYREVKVRKIDLVPTTRIPSGGSSGGGGGATTGKVKTGGSRLKMYKKKSTSSKVLKKIKNGKTVTINSTSGSWYNITYGGKTGWAKKKYIK
jgi:uncharacterized protein YgiM (DUF1202 family)